MYDEKLMFSDAQALAAGSVVSTNVLKRLSAQRIGVGARNPLVMINITALGATSLQVQLEAADNEAMTTNKQVIGQSEAKTATGLLVVAIPPAKRKQFYRLTYLLVGGAVTATVDAGIVITVPSAGIDFV